MELQTSLKENRDAKYNDEKMELDELQTRLNNIKEVYEREIPQFYQSQQSNLDAIKQLQKSSEFQQDVAGKSFYPLLAKYGFVNANNVVISRIKVAQND